jgi:hypothetical protein
VFHALQPQLDRNALDHLTRILVAVCNAAELTATMQEQLMAAWERGVHQIVARAMQRGEVAERDDQFLDLFGQVGRSLMLMRYLMAAGPIDPEFVNRIVEDLLPILVNR